MLASVQRCNESSHQRRGSCPDYNYSIAKITADGAAAGVPSTTTKTFSAALPLLPLIARLQSSLVVLSITKYYGDYTAFIVDASNVDPNTRFYCSCTEVAEYGT